MLLRNGSGADFRHPLAAGLDDGVQRVGPRRAPRRRRRRTSARSARDVSIRMRNMAANSRGRLCWQDTAASRARRGIAPTLREQQQRPEQQQQQQQQQPAKPASKSARPRRKPALKVGRGVVTAAAAAPARPAPAAAAASDDRGGRDRDGPPVIHLDDDESSVATVEDDHRIVLFVKMPDGRTMLVRKLSTDMTVSELQFAHFELERRDDAARAVVRSPAAIDASTVVRFELAGRVRLAHAAAGPHAASYDLHRGDHLRAHAGLGRLRARGGRGAAGRGRRGAGAAAAAAPGAEAARGGAGGRRGGERIEGVRRAEQEVQGQQRQQARQEGEEGRGGVRGGGARDDGARGGGARDDGARDDGARARASRATRRRRRARGAAGHASRRPRERRARGHGRAHRERDARGQRDARGEGVDPRLHLGIASAYTQLMEAIAAGAVYCHGLFDHCTHELDVNPEKMGKDATFKYHNSWTSYYGIEPPPDPNKPESTRRKKESDAAHAAARRRVGRRRPPVMHKGRWVAGTEARETAPDPKPAPAPAPETAEAHGGHEHHEPHGHEHHGHDHDGHAPPTRAARARPACTATTRTARRCSRAAAVPVYDNDGAAIAHAGAIAEWFAPTLDVVVSEAVAADGKTAEVKRAEDGEDGGVAALKVFPRTAHARAREARAARLRAGDAPRARHALPQQRRRRARLVERDAPSRPCSACASPSCARTCARRARARGRDDACTVTALRCASARPRAAARLVPAARARRAAPRIAAARRKYSEAEAELEDDEEHHEGEARWFQVDGPAGCPRLSAALHLELQPGATVLGARVRYNEFAGDAHAARAAGASVRIPHAADADDAFGRRRRAAAARSSSSSSSSDDDFSSSIHAAACGRRRGARRDADAAERASARRAGGAALITLVVRRPSVVVPRDRDLRRRRARRPRTARAARAPRPTPAPPRSDEPSTSCRRTTATPSAARFVSAHLARAVAVGAHMPHLGHPRRGGRRPPRRRRARGARTGSIAPIPTEQGADVQIDETRARLRADALVCATGSACSWRRRRRRRARPTARSRSSSATAGRCVMKPRTRARFVAFDKLRAHLVEVRHDDSTEAGMPLRRGR